MTRPLNESGYGLPQPVNRQFPAPVIAKRAPVSTDVSYPLGQEWVDKVGLNDYVLVGVSAGVATWNQQGQASGPLNTLTGDSGGAISPTAGNITLAGTSNQITITGSGAGHSLTYSIPSVFVAPGSIKSTSTLEVGTNLTVDGTSTFTGGVTLGALTVVGTVSLNATGSATTTIGGSSGAVTLAAGAGGLSVTGGGNAVSFGSDAAANVVTVGSTTGAASLALQFGTGNCTIGGVAASTITVGVAAQVGKISIADSSAAMPAVDLMNGVATGAQVLNIASGTSASGAQTVNLLNGTTPGASTTLSIMNGAATAGTQTINMLASGATRAGVVNIATGAAAHVVTIGSTTGVAATTINAGSGGIGLGTTTSLTGNLNFTTAGNKILSASVGTTTTAGANSFGSVTLSSGTATVSTTAVTSSSLIVTWRQAVGASTALGILSVGTIVNGTSFVVYAATQGTPGTPLATDASVVGYMIIN